MFPSVSNPEWGPAHLRSGESGETEFVPSPLDPRDTSSDRPDDN